MDVQQILANAPEKAVYWSPAVEQYFDRQFINLSRQFEGKFIQVEKDFRSELVDLIALKAYSQLHPQVASEEVK
ncbi:hypothetical protein R7127_23105 [Vibrio sp. 1159]|uniref:hypothetical protein n=1 Tax=Vibrio sp. 1159 TaxID=3074545 RepID=UPI00296457D4|nr:hypothetical protein [Vibrio sp. 1159]MDW2323157.1 hypothetical protein [Vibrio sp. 1159]